MIEFNNERIGSDQRPYIVAEAGVNFRDDIELGKAFVEEAAAAGADAVKFQTHVPVAEMVESEMDDLGMSDLYDRMGVYELSLEEHRELKRHCEEHDVTFLSTPFSPAAVERLEEVGVGAYKVGSGELTNHHLLRTIAETGKPMIVSTGMHDMETVRETAALLNEHASEFMFLYCVSEYPTEPSDFNLGLIERMGAEFDVPVGFSDHSTGVEAAAIAMARGAALVEKHFTIDRRLPGGDQEVSIEPEELEKLAEYATLCHETMADEKEVRDDESAIAEWARHSVVTANDVTAGETLTTEKLTTKRPGTGIPATEFENVVGSVVTRDMKADTTVRETDLE
ncbi:N-acetylneuraminate synthase [Halorubrum sp. SD690R]|uniref:N-acetylneuraminate synthase family protein n=1 Tax=Halorubrum sp. SD690R TaxID=2518117 RepID=UPI0010F98995|nr:N-acetylneuraminate synthase family protein [Halorubrum sp. SD690R]TKX47741.1 N-acetylneuraminate synthase [Halorubrum sp. SD690R]